MSSLHFVRRWGNSVRKCPDWSSHDFVDSANILQASLAQILRPTRRFNTVAQAGDILAALALGRIEPPAGRIYASLMKRQLTWPDPAELARRDDLMTALWRDSAALVGVSE